jgi:GNAT superfamily N-acetyltransferase
MKFSIRRANLADVDDIAAAHADSIRSIGPLYYDPAVVGVWSERLIGEKYANAMARGEVFFIAVGEVDGRSAVLGFSTHRVDGDRHRTAVYVRGKAARHGVGSALFQTAEAAAIAAGATSLQIDASLAGVDFYRANGFEEIGRGEFSLRSGHTMACVFMKKDLKAMR